jgi:hypothetical protein
LGRVRRVPQKEKLVAEDFGIDSMTTAALPPETEILLYTAPDGMVKQEQAVVSILEIPAADGKVYATHFYSLDDLSSKHEE